MWNIIRKTKKPVISTNAISIQTLEDYFTTKFDMPRVNTNILTQASDMVKEKYESCRTDVNVDFVLSKHSIVKYIRKLKLGTAPARAPEVWDKLIFARVIVSYVHSLCTVRGDPGKLYCRITYSNFKEN